MGLNSSAFSNARIKAEQLEDNNKSYNDDNDGTKELFNSALVYSCNIIYYLEQLLLNIINFYYRYLKL
jgi:hypothetical protein